MGRGAARGRLARDPAGAGPGAAGGRGQHVPRSAGCSRCSGTRRRPAPCSVRPSARVERGWTEPRSRAGAGACCVGVVLLCVGMLLLAACHAWARVRPPGSAVCLRRRRHHRPLRPAPGSPRRGRPVRSGPAARVRSCARSATTGSTAAALGRPSCRAAGPNSFDSFEEVLYPPPRALWPRGRDEKPRRPAGAAPRHRHHPARPVAAQVHAWMDAARLVVIGSPPRRPNAGAAVGGRAVPQRGLWDRLVVVCPPLAPAGLPRAVGPARRGRAGATTLAPYALGLPDEPGRGAGPGGPRRSSGGPRQASGATT